MSETTSLQQRGKRRAPLLEYGLAVVLVALATGFRFALEPYMGLTVPYVTFFLSNAIVIRFTKVGPSLLAIVLSTFAADYCFLPPRYTFWSPPAQYVTSATFVFANLVILAIANNLRKAKERAEANARAAATSVAERERAAGALQQSENRLSALVSATSEVLYNMSPDWSEMRQLHSRSFLANTERPNRNWLQEYIPGDEQPLVTAAINKAIQTKSIFELEHRVRRADGSLGWTYSRAVPLRDGKGAIVEWFGAANDITERKRAEEALRLSQSRLAVAQEIAQLGIWEYDVSQGVINCDKRCHDMLGLSVIRPRSLENFYALLHPDDRQRVEQQVRAALDPRGTRIYEAEYRIIRPDGNLHWMMARGNAVTLNKGSNGETEQFVGTMMDITKLKEAEEALRESAQRERNRAAELETVLNSVPAAVWIAQDPECRSITGNRTARKLLRVPEGKEFSLSAPPEKRPTHFKPVKDGKELTPDELPVQMAARGIEVRDLEHTVQFSDGTLLHLLGNATPLLDEAGRPRGSVAAFVDITERKRALEALAAAQKALKEHAANLEMTVQDRTIQLQNTNAELEHFSHTVTHDLRAPLRAMQGFTGMMLEGDCAACPSHTSKDFLSRIAKASQKMDAIIKDALDFTRAARGVMQLETIDVETILRTMLDTYPNFQRPKVEIIWEGNLPKVLGNETAVNQCFANLLGNAVKFVAPGISPKVRVWAEGKDSYARIWIEDNGIGIPKATQEKIFAPFERGHSGYEGTGLGLALVRRNIEKMGGKVGVESEPGQGSRFWLEFKIAE